MNDHIVSELRTLYTRGLTPDSIECVARHLVEEGITTPADYARFLIELMEHARTTHSPVAPTHKTSLDAIDERRNSNLRLVHRPPAGEFYWHGTAIEPQDIHRFNGQVLHFVVVGQGPSDTRLMACESFREVIEILQQRNLLHLLRAEAEHQALPGELLPDPTGDPVQPMSLRILFEPARPSEPPDGASPSGGYVTCGRGPSKPNGEAQCFEHSDFDDDGHWFWLGPRLQIARLTEWRLSHALFAGDTSWNDQISSIKGGDGLLIAYEHIDFQGSTFSVCGSGAPRPIYSGRHPICGPYLVGWKFPGSRQEAPNLGIFGWNDRISSLQHLL